MARFMLSKHATLGVAGLSLYLLSLPIYATPTLPSQTLDTLNAVDAKQQQRQSEQNAQRESQLTPSNRVSFDNPKSAELTLPEHESPCYPIQAIQLVDYSPNTTITPSSLSSFSQSQFHWAYQKAQQSLKLHLPQCLGGEGLGVIMKQIQNNIIDKGYVTTRVVAQEQDLHSGTLVLTVIVGKVGNTLVIDRGNVPRFTKLHALTGLTFAKGDILNIRDIEQSLENLKRVPTVDANIDIVPADNVGESDLKITYTQAFPFRLNIGLDDSGSTSTGKWQGSATLSWDNLFSANDLFYTSFTHSIKRHSDDVGSRGTKNLTFYYSIPFGYWGLSASHSQNRYHQQVFGAFNNNYIYSGESRTDKLTLSYLLYRDAVRKTTLSGSLWSRQSKNFIDGTEIDVQRRRMAGWEMGIVHKEYIGDATLELGVHYKQGTGARGSLPAPEEYWANEGTSRPKIITASVNWSQPISFFNQEMKWESQWSAQWNKTPLIAQDRFSLGGRYTVRGFDGELSLSGERGWLWRNDVSWNIAHKGQWLYLALDGGRVMGGSTEQQLGRHLVGGAIGLHGSWHGFYYDYFVGKPLNKPEGFRTSKTVTGFNLGYSF